MTPEDAADAPLALECVSVSVDRDGPTVVLSARVRDRATGFILTLPEQQAQLLAANLYAATGRRSLPYSHSADLAGALDVT